MATAVNPISTPFGPMLVGLLLLSGCDRRVSNSPQPSGSIAPAQTASVPPSPIVSPRLSPQPSSQPSPAQTVTVKIYKADSQCESFVSTSAQVPKQRSMEAAVGKVIAAQRNADFDLAGYRVSQTNGIATIDLRVAPNSRRQMVSLSSCEQFALFGSLRETLTRNPQWQVKSVRFTNRGKAIVF